MIEYWFISACIVWLFFIVIKAFVHFRTIEFEGQSTHTGRYRVLNWILTCMASIMSMILYNPENGDQIRDLIAFQSLSHAVIFAPLLNVLRGKPYFYLGLESGWFDRFFAERPLAYKILYFSGVVLFILSIIMLRTVTFPA